MASTQSLPDQHPGPQDASSLTGGRPRSSPKPVTHNCERSQSLSELCQDHSQCSNHLPQEEVGDNELRHNKYIEMRETDQGAEESYGVFAKTNIKSNVVLTSFGDSKYLLGPDAKTMYSLIAKYNSASGPGDEKFQYTFSYHPPGHHEQLVTVMPTPDVKLANRVLNVPDPLGYTLRQWENQAEELPGMGHRINHTCCDEHANVSFELMYPPSDDDDDDEPRPILTVRSTKEISQNTECLANYGGLLQTMDHWRDIFKCSCCVCDPDGTCHVPKTTKRDSAFGKS
jgi:hypothetical protein